MGCFDGGQVWVLPGDYDGWPSSMTADRIVNQLGGVHLYSSNPGDRLGSSVGYPGDVDGDGHADLLVGSSGANGDVGAAYLLYGPVPAGSWNVGQVGTRNLPGVRIDGVQADGQFGWALTTLGDTNDDGYDDFALSAPTATSLVGDDGSGRVYVFLGRGD